MQNSLFEASLSAMMRGKGRQMAALSDYCDSARGEFNIRRARRTLLGYSTALRAVQCKNYSARDSFQ